MGGWGVGGVLRDDALLRLRDVASLALIDQAAVSLDTVLCHCVLAATSAITNGWLQRNAHCRALPHAATSLSRCRGVTVILDVQHNRRTCAIGAPSFDSSQRRSHHLCDVNWELANGGLQCNDFNLRAPSIHWQWKM